MIIQAEDVAYSRYPLLRYDRGIFVAVLFTINLVFHVVSLFFLLFSIVCDFSVDILSDLNFYLKYLKISLFDIFA